MLLIVFQPLTVMTRSILIRRVRVHRPASPALALQLPVNVNHLLTQINACLEEGLLFRSTVCVKCCTVCM